MPGCAFPLPGTSIDHHEYGAVRANLFAEIYYTVFDEVDRTVNSDDRGVCACAPGLRSERLSKWAFTKNLNTADDIFPTNRSDET